MLLNYLAAVHLFNPLGILNMSDLNNSSTSIFGWKGVWIAVILAALFLGILYLAMSNEPDYMPSNQAGNKHSQHGSSHSMAKENAAPTAAEMNMSSAEHAAHQQQSASSAHSH